VVVKEEASMAVLGQLEARVVQEEAAVITTALVEQVQVVKVMQVATLLE
tara:strand:+ start:1547 stop:1693 length:147 start_codon:yes stop_codon:yes gene_type:complete